MDAGVIKNLKLHYRIQLVRQRLAAHEEGILFQFDILDSMRLLRRAWYMVQPETIVNCYKSVGLDADERNEEQGKTDDSSDFASSDCDKNDWDATRCISIPDGVDFNDNVSIDDNTAVSEVPSDRDIVAAVSDHAVIDGSDDDHEIGAYELERERPIVTTKDALRAFKVITQYYDAHGSDDNLDINFFCIDKDLQRRLSSAKK
jgi:hypothetical protein